MRKNANFITNMEYAELCVNHARQDPPAVITLEMLKLKTGKEDILDFMNCLTQAGATNVSFHVNSSGDIFNFRVDFLVNG